MRSLTMMCVVFLCCFGLSRAAEVQATTHWVVTETGLIQPRLDSPYDMARPYDLLAFLNQDVRLQNLKRQFYDLSRRQIEIMKLWTEIMEASVIDKYLDSDETCVKAGRLTEINWYVAPLEEGLSKHIPREEYYLSTPILAELVPDCMEYHSLTYNMGVFEHLESMLNRTNLTINPELYLPELISPLMTVDIFGQWVASVLLNNSTSWLHYNLASLYWRVKGKAPKAVECSRIAIHLAPRQYKDIALQGLGTIFHLAKRPDDAIIILKAAVDHDPTNFFANYILASAYAVAGDFNTSLIYFNKSLKLNPTFEYAIQNKYAVLCERELAQRMMVVDRKIQNLTRMLKDQREEERIWLEMQVLFLRHIRDYEDIETRQLNKVIQKMSRITGLNISELNREGYRNTWISYFLDDSIYKDVWASSRGPQIVEVAYRFQNLMKRILLNINIIPDEDYDPNSDNWLPVPEIKGDGPMIPDLGPSDLFLWLANLKGGANSQSEENAESPLGTNSEEPSTVDTKEEDLNIPKYPPSMKIDRNREDFDRVADWPPDGLCSSFKGLPSYEGTPYVYATFLPFENKGISLKGLLSSKIGVGVDKEHDLPWHPPVCPSTKDMAATLKKAHKPQLTIEVVESNYLRLKLWEYVLGDDDYLADDRWRLRQEAEIGQRIHAAMQKNVAPKWVLYTLASLYWRVRGNNQNALTCLLAASRLGRHQWKDVVFTSLASVYLEMGVLDEAFHAAEEAFRISLYEPATNFLLAQLNYVKKHRNTHLFHLKQVLRVDPHYMDGLARSMLLLFSCHIQAMNSARDAFVAEVAESCESETADSAACDGCHRPPAPLCRAVPTSTIIRMLLKDDPIQPDTMDENIFEAIIMRTPEDASDIEGHNRNFDLMVQIFKSFRGCGKKGCSSITVEDLSLDQDECPDQSSELAQWLLTVTFRDIVVEHLDKLMLHMTSAPTEKRFPECTVDRGADFYAGRLLATQAVGWQPIPILIDQMADMFQEPDFVALGAKFAEVLESRGGAWLGAVGAAWWCGAGGRGRCAVGCSAAAYALAPPPLRQLAARSLAAMLMLHANYQEAKKIAYLGFYMSPKSKVDSYMVALSNTYLEEYEQAVWMYRYALTLDEDFLPAKACLHAALCLMLYGDKARQHYDSRLPI